MRIYIDENGVTRYEKYLSYIEQSRERFSENIYVFASDVSRYELTGTKTLHDAWVEKFHVENNYSGDSNSLTSSIIVLGLRLRSGIFLEIKYSDVVGFEYLNFLERWSDKASDLISHEFSVGSEGTYFHEIEFDRGGALKIKFKSISFIESP